MINLILRTATVYLATVFSMRLMGKKIAGQLQPYELVITLMIAEVASSPIDSETIPLFSGLIPALTLIIMYSLISFLNLKSKKLRTFFCGSPTVVIKDGKVIEEALHRQSYNLSELLEQLRSCGYDDVRKIAYAVLETNGELSVFPYIKESSPTLKDLNISADENSIQIPLILDGNIIPFGLKELEISESSLKTMLKSMGIEDIKDVFMLTKAKNGDFYIHNTEKRSISK